MPQTPRKMIFFIATAGLASVLGILTSCSASKVKDSDVPLRKLISLERTVHFSKASGDSTQVQPGTYDISSSQGKLQLTGDNTDKPIRLETQETTHDETVDTITPLSFSEQEDEHVVMLLFPDGTALETIGSYTGIQSRAVRRSGKRVSPAVIKRQFTQRKRIPQATPYHFTFRVPVQLNNLSPDINQFKIRCKTFSGNDATKHDQTIGEAEVITNLINRQFNGTIAVRFNATHGKEPEHADTYYCSLMLHKPGIGFRQPAKFGSPSANSAPAWRVSANGTSFLRGTLAPVN